MDTPTPSVFHLSDAQKLQLVQELWDDLASNPESVPVFDWQKQELERRKFNLLMRPGSGRTWDDVKARLRARHDR